MTSRRTRLLVLTAVGALTLAACGGDDSADTTDAPSTDAPTTDAPTTDAPTTDAPTTDAPTTDAPTTDAPTTDAPAEGWAVNTDDCVDPDAANEPIEGTVKIGSAMPLSGGAAAAAFAPVASGFEAYIDYANENGLLEGYTIEIDIQDDQYSKDLTPGVVESLLDSGVHMFSGIIGSPNNAAVRDLLNEECYPQLMALTGSPQWGEVADYPWTTGALIPYPTEVQGYLAQLATEFPDGGTMGLFTVNNEFGQFYVDALKEHAGDFGWEIVDEQTIEAAETAPPTAQVNSIASKAPDVVMAVPLGAQCATFLSEVQNAKAANAGWNPPVYVTSTCASQLILQLAGPAATGLITSASAGINDIGNPEVVASNPDYQAYADYMTSTGRAEMVTTGAAGWTVAEVTVEILRQAAASEAGLTRASIINAARNFTYEPTLVRDGVVYSMNGEEDPFIVEAIQVVQFDATSSTFTDIGELVLDFESS